MNDRQIRVLLLEDNPADARLVSITLGKADPGITIEQVERVAAAEERLRDRSAPVDAVLADLHLPDSFGIDTLTRLRAADPDIPIVVLTGSFEEKAGIHAVAAGAQDYFIKEELAGRSLARAIRFGIERQTIQRALAEANRELTRSRDELERRVEERTAEISQANRDLETMLYVATHDLREPVNSVLAFSQTILEERSGTMDEWMKDRLWRTEKAAERMSKLLDGLMVVARARRIEPPEETTACGDVVREVLDHYEQWIRDLGARLVVAKGFPHLKVNRTWLVEVVSNLVTNALKFTKPGSAPEIEIDRYEGPEGHGIVVRDRGTGISEGMEERIFQLFQRAVGREVEGVGAGLAIVQQIAHRHGGKAWVRRREGGGLEFFVTFEPATGARARLNLLLVDDDDDFVIIAREMLAANPLVRRIEVARDGVEALACLRKINGHAEVPTPHLVLLDLNMPRKNGFEVLAEIQGDPHLRTIPVAVLTGSVRRDDEERARAHGAVAFLTKPLRLEQLSRVVEEMGVVG